METKNLQLLLSHINVHAHDIPFEDLLPKERPDSPRSDGTTWIANFLKNCLYHSRD